MMTMGSRFEALRTHAHLVVTISEEKQLFEANLKLVMLRVNAATSLLKWAREEGNPALRSMVEKLYNITLMWATVQKQYAEQCLGFSKSLDSILQIEQGLDAIRKQRNSSKEKIENLQKQVDASKRKSDLSKLKQFQEELIKHTSDEEELAAELQVKFIKGEIFKTKVLKAALHELMDAYSENADRTKIICNASANVIDELPEVPKFLASEEKVKEEDDAESQKAIKELATALGLSGNLPPSQNYKTVKKVSKSSPPLSPPRPRGETSPEEPKVSSEDRTGDPKATAEPRNNQESKAKKRLSKLPSALAANFHMPRLKRNKFKGKQSPSEDDEIDNFVIIPSANNAAPHCQPPALPLGYRRRSKSSIEIGILRQPPDRQQLPRPVDDSQSTDGAENKNGSDNEDDDDDDDDDLYEDPNYILPNSYTDDPSKLTRWSSDNALSKATLPAYREPLDIYEQLWSEMSENDATSEPIYDLPYDSPNLPKLSPAPKKPLPEAPLDNAPPKPRRGVVSEAFYINTNDVEKLLHEIYEDSRLNEDVKPEVKQRALKKIRQERIQESQLELQRHQEVIELDTGITAEQGNEDSIQPEPSYVNLSPNNNPNETGDKEEHPPQTKRIPDKHPPKVPLRPHTKPEASGTQMKETPSTTPAHGLSSVPVARPPAKTNLEKNYRPKVPPRPGHLP